MCMPCACGGGGGKGFGGKGFGHGGGKGFGKGFGGGKGGGKGGVGRGGPGTPPGLHGRPGLALAHALQIPLPDARAIRPRARDGDENARVAVKAALKATPQWRTHWRAATLGDPHAHRARKLAKALGCDVEVARAALVAGRGGGKAAEGEDGAADGGNAPKPARPAKVIAEKLGMPLPDARVLLHAAINGDEAARARLAAGLGIERGASSGDAMTATEDEADEDAAAAVAMAVAVAAADSGEDSDMGWDAIDETATELQAVKIA